MAKLNPLRRLLLSFRLLRSLMRELRGIRVALQELAQLQRTLINLQHPGRGFVTGAPDGLDDSATVSFRSNQELSELIAIEEELTRKLGRPPDADQIAAIYDERHPS